jgi:hypothetical protein
MSMLCIARGNAAMAKQVQWWQLAYSGLIRDTRLMLRAYLVNPFVVHPTSCLPSSSALPPYNLLAIDSVAVVRTRRRPSA